MAQNCDLLARGEELYDIVDDPSFFFVPRGDAAPGTPAPAASVSDEVLAERQARLRVETAQRCGGANDALATRAGLGSLATAESR